MEYSISGRAKKVNKLVLKILPRFIFFKLYSYFLSNDSKAKKLTKLHSKTATEIAAVLMELEGLFLKLAQQISTMSGLLPNAYIEAFEKAQSHSTPRPFNQIQKRIEQELNDSIENLFISIDKTPIGVASIGQVHKAQLKTGEQVAVKVQHLNIEAIAQLDLQLIEKILKLVQRFIKIPGFDGVFEEVVKMIQEELDYTHEAEQIKLLSTNLKGDNRIIIPKTYNSYCTKKVLVMEFTEGEKITNSNFIKANGINQDLIAKNLLDIFSKNIFIDGVFHADPHPGNVLVNKEGQIVLIDFGAVGRLSHSMKEGMIVLMQAAILKDENLMIEGFKTMGFISNGPGIDKVCKKIIHLMEDFLVNELKLEKINLSEIKIDEVNISKVFKLLKEINIKEMEEVIRIPKDWVLLNRTIALVMGISSELAPTVDIFETVKPNLLQMAIQKESLGMILKTTLQQQILRIVSLPRKMELFLAQAENGEIEVNVKSRKIESKLQYALFQQIIFIIGAIGTYALYTSNLNKGFLYAAILFTALFGKAFISGLIYRRKIK